MRDRTHTPMFTPESGDEYLLHRPDFVSAAPDPERCQLSSDGSVVRTTAEIAADSLTLKIFNGHFEPGARLPEVALAEELGISRNTLREAFRLLAHAGLVEHLPNRGVFVLKTTAALLRDIYSFRRAVEVGALPALIRNEEALQKLRAVYADQQKAIREANWMLVGSANGRFHQTIVDSAGSPTLSEGMQTINARSRIAFLEYADTPGLHSRFSKVNGHILSVVEQRDLREAVTLLDNYLVEAHNELFIGLGFDKFPAD
ncbi:MAG: GntR family transcriptional regulator [Corynebacterium glucuronolyticum]|nr:GntR family transcriptional regulator [Corynebacterium glucuronolyticum]